MKFLRLYRVSFYLMLFLATLILCIESANDSNVAKMLPIAVAIVGVLALSTVDRDPRLGLSLGAATLLSWMAIFLCFLEYRSDESKIVPPLSHWLTYLQMIKMFRSKTHEDEWYLFLLGLIQVLVGAVLNTGGELIGPLVLIWALWSIWTLCLFYLNRASRRADIKLAAAANLTASQAGASSANFAKTKAKTKRAKAATIRERYLGLLDRSFVFSAIRISLTSVMLGCIVFVLAPRTGANSGMGQIPTAQNLTGFDGNQVKLGRIGEILESDAMVMTIQLSDDATGAMLTENDVTEEKRLWRGTTLTRYDRGAWNRTASNDSISSNYVGRFESLPPKRIRQTITLERTNSLIRFGLRPMLKIDRNDDIDFQRPDGTLRVTTPGKSLSYKLVSSANETDSQVNETPLNPTIDVDRVSNQEELGGQDSELLDRLRPIAEKVVQGIPDDQPEARARKLEWWLRDSKEFGYSLMMNVIDPSLDPVEDFLINRKEGHCEYYSSSLTLLLRSIHIPARVVNGFKGGDWDGYNQIFHVRQKHAHSWVEAWVYPQLDVDKQKWITLDPTPSGPRSESVSKVGGMSPGFRQLSDALRYVWVVYVQGFNADRQNRVIYEPLKRVFQQTKEGFGLIWQYLKNLLSFRDWKAFFEPKGAFTTFALLLSLVGVWKLGSWLVRRLRRWIWPGSKRASGFGLETASYLRLIKLLKSCGFDRPDSETPREFAVRVGSLLSNRIRDNQQSVSEVPLTIVDAFYRVRFGDHALESDEAELLDSQLDALESALKAA